MAGDESGRNLDDTSWAREKEVSSAAHDRRQQHASTTRHEGSQETGSERKVRHLNGGGGGEVQTSTAWIYRSRNVGSLRLPCYASTNSQLVMVAFVCFLCPGMFNALGGLGGGGQVDPTTADNANVILYSVFAFVGFFAGSICNRLGVKITIAFGGFGYFMYAASFLSYNINQNRGFVYFAGALLGVCAALLWTAQGAIMTSYPPEGSKGRYIATFWVIFNLGAVIGSLVPLGVNIDRTSAASVSNGTYIGFMVLMFVGFVLAGVGLLDTEKVVREADGSRVIIMKHPTWKSEFVGLYQTLRDQTWVLLLFPMFWASNWFYTYQFNNVNAARFDTRTRALNSLLYWLSQMFGASLFGWALDYGSENGPGEDVGTGEPSREGESKRRKKTTTMTIRRSTKARIAWIALFVITFAIWGGGYAWQVQYTRTSNSAGDPDFEVWDWKHGGYAGPMFLYMFYGFFDAVWQTCVYWFMGAMTNNSRRLANFVGFYKGIQSAGAAVVFRIDALGVSYMREFISCWALLAGSLAVALPVIWFKIQDTTSIEDDLRFSDETIGEVLDADVDKAEGTGVGKGGSGEK